MSLLCVTNSMRNVRSCVVRGEHASHCDGWRGVKECKGCLPKQAQHGLLCIHCWERVVSTMSVWPRFANTIEGLDRLVVHDSAGVRGKAGSRIPIPQTWLDVEEVESFLKTYHDAGDNLEYWVSSEQGAKDSINFCVTADRAMRSHPIEEKAHRITRARCTECKFPSLVWIPTQYQGDEVTVKCKNPECGHEMDQSTFELLAQVEGSKK